MIKHIFLTNFFLFVVLISISQSLSINTDGTDADTSAILDIKSTDKGLLLPRMTLGQRNAIIFPAHSLLIYQVDNVTGIYINVGIPAAPTWQLLSSGWSVIGNAGTTDIIDFIGTTDNVPLNIRVNNQQAGRIDHLLANIMFGQLAGGANTAGYNISAVGNKALYSNTTGNSNSAFGTESLYFNTTGNSNTAVGFHAISNNVAGHNATAIGYNAMLYSNNSPVSFENYNVAVGYEALRGSSVPSDNIGNNNAALGYKVLWSNSSGNNNTGVGFNSLYSNSTGANNTGMGVYSLLNNNGSFNTSYGFATLKANVNGEHNVAVGDNTLLNNISGSYNIAIGSGAMQENTSGIYNTIIGYSSLPGNTTGSRNTAVGTDAGTNNVDGDFNTSLGYGSYATISNAFNTTTLGCQARASVDNEIVIGNTSVTSIGGYANWSNLSDGRFKIDIQDNVPGVDFILKLHPITYRLDMQKLNKFLFNNTAQNYENMMSSSIVKKQQIIYSGFVAQDVEQVAMSIGYNFSGVIPPQNSEDHYRLSYSDFVVPLVKAVQEQNILIKGLKAENENLKEQIKNIYVDINDLKKKMKSR